MRVVCFDSNEDFLDQVQEVEGFRTLRICGLDFIYVIWQPLFKGFNRNRHIPTTLCHLIRLKYLTIDTSP